MCTIIKRCNCCGKEIEVKNGVPTEEFLEVKKSWGYFSNKDGQVHTFLICEECYDKWTARFLEPVKQEEETELI